MTTAEPSGSPYWLGALALRVTELVDDDLTTKAKETIRLTLADTLAVSLAALGDESVAATRHLAHHAQGPSSIWGTGRTTGMEQAIMTNATAAHVLDYDDVNNAMGGHPSAVLWPCLIALAESRGETDGLDCAYAAGLLTAASLGQMSASLSRAGFHPTAIIGAVACAAAASRLMHQDVTQTTYAMGIAASQAAGLTGAFGTAAKPLQCARAAVTGAVAACLATQGIKSRLDILECPNGLFSALTREPSIRYSASPMTVLEDNLFKFHAACYWSHSAIEAALALRRDHNFPTDDVTHIEITVSGLAKDACRIIDPLSGTEAKFSIAHVVALALCGIDTSKVAVYDTALIDPQVGALRACTTFRESPSSCSSTWTSVVINTHSGQQLKADADVIADPISREHVNRRVRQKFSALTTGPLGDTNSARLLVAIMDPQASSPNVEVLRLAAAACLSS